MNILRKRGHSMLDYTAAVALVAAPFVLGLAQKNIMVAWVSGTLGVALFFYSLITDYEYSVTGVVSFKVHLLFDFSLGLIAIAIPFLMNMGPAATGYFAVMGVGVILVVAVSDPG